MLIVPIPWWLWLIALPALLTYRLTLIASVTTIRLVAALYRACRRRWQLRHA